MPSFGRLSGEVDMPLELNEIARIAAGSEGPLVDVGNQLRRGG